MTLAYFGGSGNRPPTGLSDSDVRAITTFIEDPGSASRPKARPKDPVPVGKGDVSGELRPLPRLAYAPSYVIAAPQPFGPRGRGFGITDPQGNILGYTERDPRPPTGKFDGFTEELQTRVPLSVTEGAATFRVIRDAQDKIPVYGNWVPGLVKDSVATGITSVITAGTFRGIQPGSGSVASRDENELRRPRDIPVPRHDWRIGPNERDSLVTRPGQNPAWARESDINDRLRTVSDFVAERHKAPEISIGKRKK